MKAVEYTGWRMSRACAKASSGGFWSLALGSDGSVASLPGALSSRNSVAQRPALRLRLLSSQDSWVTAGRSRTKLCAWPMKSSMSVSRFISSLAMRTSCSWFSIRCRRSCCCTISVSRFSDSVSRSTSSLRRYQKAEMIAARNSSTDASGASVTKRSCRAAGWCTHQRPSKRRVRCQADGGVGVARVEAMAWIIGVQRDLAVERDNSYYEIIKRYLKFRARYATLAVNCKNVRSTHKTGDTMSALPDPRPRRCRQRFRRPGNPRMAGRAGRGHRVRRGRACALPARAADRGSAPARHRHAVLGEHRLRQHHRAGGRGAQPRQPRARRPAARLHALERDGDGGQGQPAATRPTAATWAATSAPSRRWRTCSPPASTTSGMPTAKAMAATCSTSRATARPASTRAPSWKAASPRSRCSTSARKWRARGCRAIRTRS